MGKSGKKIKSDRINTLRKQYDAFLEDDKKRKHRNEFILGRLEEMRSSSALVKIQHKEIPQVNDYYYSSRGMPSYLSSSSRIEKDLRPFRNTTNIENDSITQQFEPSILREISKKYILIPKLQTCFSNRENYHNTTTENADTDWKSKYNILNELKKNEKETIPESRNIIFEEQIKPVPTQESLNKQENKVNDNIALKDNMHSYNMNITNYDIQGSQLNSNTKETEVLDKNLDLKSLNNSENTIPRVENFNKDNIFHSSETKENNEYTTSVKNVCKTEVPQQQVTEHKPEINTNTDVYNDIKNSTSQDLQNIDENKEDNQYKEKSDQEKFDKDSIMQQNKTEEYFEQDIKENIIENTERTDLQELTNNDDIPAPEDLQEGVQSYKETEPESYNIQSYEPNEAPVISDETANAEVNELENEQNVMFYTENPENQYDYQNNVDAVGYSAENENYATDHNQYNYHSESQQQQPYTSEVNEHEESTERYDPNYEQQYAENNYENVTDTPQYDNQQYEIDNSYQIQQDPLASNVNYEEVHPNNENFEHMPSDNTGISYQNQEENVYNYENENYEAQQYVTNEQQEYSTTDPNNQEQYVTEQEYIQEQGYIPTEQETIKDMETGLDSEQGYIDNQNTILTDNTENTIIPDVSPDETESSLKAS